MTEPLPKREPSPVAAIEVYGGYQAKFRKATGGWDWVRVNGVPHPFDTADAALLAAWQARDAHFHGHGILSTGEKSAAHIAADKLFPGKGRCVRVEHR